MEKVTEFTIAKQLSKRYPSPAYSFLTRVRNQTGYSKQIRTADALAMSLYPSRGLHLEGFEIKVSRTDWLKEVSDPAKADEISKFCNYWWIVISDISIVNLSEVPQNWGLIVSKKNGNKVIKDAPLLKPEPPDLQLLCGIMRNVSENFVNKDDFQELLKDREKYWSSEQKYDLEKANEKLKRLEVFKEASGIDPLEGWNREKKIGLAVSLLLDVEEEIGWRIDSAHKNLKEALQKFDKASEEMKGLIILKDK